MYSAALIILRRAEVSHKARDEGSATRDMNETERSSTSPLRVLAAQLHSDWTPLMGRTGLDRVYNMHAAYEESVSWPS